MQAQVDSCIQSTIARFETIPPTHRLLISVAGIPGSGKTTLVSRVVRGINQKLGDVVAAMIPMDGYHLTRADLDKMPDPAHAHFCRGAHWTFNPAALAKLVKECREPIGETLFAPSFDHKVKDPVEGDVLITPGQRILIFEGLYLSLSAPEEWAVVSSLFDERWLVEVDEDTAKRRLARRHFEAGISQSLEDGLRRAEGNDIPNGRFLLENRVEFDKVLKSEEDEGW
ncbi:P-loop containing nucleoside triphosphate hydrolase protein [Trichophaea hybrida]|nr:P-loop containing nucleoside triphosphate hydrolase protein [Trichophaea hybrida]